MQNGINDLIKIKNLNITNYEQISRTLNNRLPESRIYVQSLYPVAKSFVNNKSIFFSEKDIYRTNDRIRNLCLRFSNCYFVDIYILCLLISMDFYPKKYFEIADELNKIIYAKELHD